MFVTIAGREKRGVKIHSQEEIKQNTVTHKTESMFGAFGLFIE